MSDHRPGPVTIHPDQLQVSTENPAGPTAPHIPQGPIAVPGSSHHTPPTPPTHTVPDLRHPDPLHQHQPDVDANEQSQMEKE